MSSLQRAAPLGFRSCQSVEVAEVAEVVKEVAAAASERSVSVSLMVDGLGFRV